jgi:glycosyltransferase involved in cell wall biosynthesis
VSTIVHLTTVHGPFDTRIFQKECRTLAETGHCVALIAPHTCHETVDGVEIVPLPRIAQRAARILLVPWRAFRAARARPADLYHFHDPELLPVGVLLKWTTHARVVYDAHENYARRMSGRHWMPRLLRPILPRLVGEVERWAVRRLDAVVCATEHIAAQFPHTRTAVVKNYPLLKMSPPAPDPAQFDAHNVTVIYTGGWTEHRGVYQLVQAMQHVKTPGACLIVLGKCVSPALQRRAQSLPGYARVDYRGTVPFEQVYLHMRRAAIGLVCNQPQHDYEMSQPNKLFEYMSAGSPVIASHFPLWKEVVEGNNCGLTVDPTQPEAIAYTIDYLLARPERREKMGRNGLKAIQTTYSWQAEAKKLVILYEELLKNVKTGPNTIKE